MKTPRWTIQIRASRRDGDGKCDACRAYDCDQPDAYDVGIIPRGGYGFLTIYGRAHTRAEAIARAEVNREKDRQRMAVLDADKETMTPETTKLSTAIVHIKDLLAAMRVWGSQEDGIPEAGPDEMGSIGRAYDAGMQFIEQVDKETRECDDVNLEACGTTRTR